MTTATATDVKTSAQILEGVDDGIKSMAKRIEELVALDVSTGLVPEKEDGSVYKLGLEINNVSEEEVGRVKKAEANITTAHTLAIGNIGRAAQSKHKDLGTVQGTIAMYGDEKFTSGIHRESIGRNPKTGETSTIYGQTFTTLQTTTTANKGQMGKVRSFLKAAALEQHNKSNS